MFVKLFRHASQRAASEHSSVTVSTESAGGPAPLVEMAGDASCHAPTPESVNSGWEPERIDRCNRKVITYLFYPLVQDSSVGGTESVGKRHRIVSTMDKLPRNCAGKRNKAQIFTQLCCANLSLL